MRYGISLLALLFAMSAGTAQVDAQGRGQGQVNKPTSSGAKQAGGKTDHAKPATAKAPKSTAATTTTKKTTPTANAKKTSPTATGTDARVKGNPKKATTTTGTTTGTATPVVDVLPTTPTTAHVKNPKLEARLLALLPNLPVGTTIQDVSAGFKNWGQFVAAVHVSNNLGLDFTQLKTAMTGLTPNPVPGAPPIQTGTPMSLGQAIKTVTSGTTAPDGTTLTPTTITTEVKKAEDAATSDLRRTRGRS
jgi:hypothetical protein